MNPQSFSMPQEGIRDHWSTGSTEADFYTNHTLDSHIFPADFSTDPTVVPQQYNLTTSFGSYTQTSPIDMTQAWATPQSQYAELPLQSSVPQGLPPLVPRLSIARSLASDEGGDTSEPTSPRDEASERRKERRRAQNRAAQRAFRARKEDTIKESSVRLGAMQEELIRLESVNGNLSDTVSRLRSEITRLHQENAALRGKRTKETIAWDYAHDDEGSSGEIIRSARLSLDEHEGRAMGFGVNGGMIGTIQWQDTGGSNGQRDEDKSVAEVVVNAAAALTRGVF